MSVEAIQFTVDQQTLKGNIFKPHDHTRAVGVLFVHGWTGKPNKPAAQVLADHGFQAMTFSLRGHNDSDGDINIISRRHSLHDAVAAYDFFRDQLPVDKAVAVVGNSYGSYIAALLSGERQIARLSLRVPTNYPDARFNEVQLGQGNADPAVAEWRRRPIVYSDNMALHAIHNFAGMVQIIEGENDESIPPQTVDNWVRAVADPSQVEYRLMEGWPHSLGDDAVRNQKFQQTLLSWLLRQDERV